MPFKLGPQPIRRSLKYLEAGSLVFKDRVKVMTLNYNVDEFAHQMAATHPGIVPFRKELEWQTKSGEH